MNQSSKRWKPRYKIVPAIARGLMDIEAARAIVAHTPLTPSEEALLRLQARIRSTHYSTQIEGNRLTLSEAQRVIEGRLGRFHGRERDVREVQNYWNALLKVEKWAQQKKPLTEALVQRLHALVEKGVRAKPTPYRTGQNVIRDSASGSIVYMPPEARDVSGLIHAMIAWVSQAEKDNLPIPLVAGLVHYQFVTIHPYYDGNGRTARLLATFILHRGGYDLNGFFSMEEHHARDLEGYYRFLAVHPHHNYYEGRAESDITPWIQYFIITLAEVFTRAQGDVLNRAGKGAAPEPDALRRLDRRARILVKTWVDDGLLTVTSMAKRNRAYGLSAIYRQ
jgi:Fic family protein